MRMGLLWAGVEPEEGVYNETLIEQMNGLITKLGEKGIYTFVDSH